MLTAISGVGDVIMSCVQFLCFIILKQGEATLKSPRTLKFFKSSVVLLFKALLISPLPEAIAAAVSSVDDDIMSRRMPLAGRYGHSNSYDVRVTKRPTSKGCKAYSLRPGDVPPTLQPELDAFLYHCTNRFCGGHCHVNTLLR